jgi:hypothetical protein
MASPFGRVCSHAPSLKGGGELDSSADNRGFIVAYGRSHRFGSRSGKFGRRSSHFPTWPSRTGWPKCGCPDVGERFVNNSALSCRCLGETLQAVSSTYVASRSPERARRNPMGLESGLLPICILASCARNRSHVSDCDVSIFLSPARVIPITARSRHLQRQSDR